MEAAGETAGHRVRRKKTAAERRQQARRAEARLIGRLLAAAASLGHRGSRPSRLLSALSAALQGPAAAAGGAAGGPAAEEHPAPPAPAEAIDVDEALFEAAESFSGHRPGYIFKKGDMGLGYYADLHGRGPAGEAQVGPAVGPAASAAPASGGAPPRRAASPGGRTRQSEGERSSGAAKAGPSAPAGSGSRAYARGMLVVLGATSGHQGAVGRLEDFDEKAGRWTVCFDNGGTLRLRERGFAIAPADAVPSPPGELARLGVQATDFASFARSRQQ